MSISLSKRWARCWENSRPYRNKESAAVEQLYDEVLKKAGPRPERRGTCDRYREFGETSGFANGTVPDAAADARGLIK